MRNVNKAFDSLGTADESRELTLDFLPKILKFHSFGGLVPLTSSSVFTHLDGRLRFCHVILGAIEVDGWKL